MSVFLAALGLASVLPPAQPNIIYILADDLGYGEVGAFGQQKIRTPHLDRMAAEGMKFTQHYTGAPVCAPARSALLEGKHSGHTQIRDNSEVPGPFYGPEAQEGQRPLMEGTYTIARMLQEAGYETGGVGKWGNGGPGSPGRPTEQGFDFWCGYLCQRQAHNYYPTHLWLNDYRLDMNNRFFLPAQKFEGDPENPADFDKYKGKVYAGDIMQDQALQFIRKNKDNPFFLYVADPAPHLALQVPDDSVQEYVGEFDEEPYLGGGGYLPHPHPYSAYAGMITRMDDRVGEMLALLEELGLEDNTLIIFTSDNGPTHDVGGVNTEFFNSAGGLRGRKGSVWEGGIRVPTIAYWPGRVPAGTTSDLVSAHWDMMPTFAELAGGRAPRDTDGISVVPTLLGRSGQRRHEFLLWEFPGYGGQQAVRMGQWKAVRRDIKQNPNAPIQLFNLSVDEAERDDVADQHPEIVERARQIMQEQRTPAILPAWNEWLGLGVGSW